MKLRALGEFVQESWWIHAKVGFDVVLRICWPRIFGLENLLPELCRVSSLAGPWIVLLKRHPPLGISVKIKAHIAATASRVRYQDGVHKYHIQ